MVSRAAIVGLLALLAGCEEPPCTDMTRSEGGLVVVEAEHPSGWEQDACDACHARTSLHDRGCTPGVDLAAVRAEVAADPTTESCHRCHGDNGGNR